VAAICDAPSLAMAKTVPKSKFVELRGLDRISTVVHDQLKCLFREISKDDFGIDGEIEVVTPKENGKGFETNGSIVKVQAKSGDSFVVEDSEDSFSTPVKRVDLETWNSSTFPVLFIVYHPRDDKLYATEVKSYVAKTPGVFATPHKIRFTKSTDEFNGNYYSTLAHHAKVSPPRLSFLEKEKLYSNLLPVKRLPKCYVASSLRSSYDELRAEIEWFTPPFTIADKKVYTLDNLNDPDSVFHEYIQGKIEPWPGKKMLADEKHRGNYIYLLNRLMGLHNRHCGIHYNKQYRRNYFPRQNDTDLEFKTDWVSVRTGKKAPERTLAKYYEYGAFKFWRHLAANLSFVELGDELYLQVIPKYFFTNDGEEPCNPDLVGPYTTRVKAAERNNRVLNHVLFWSYALSEGRDAIKMRLHGQEIMTVDRVPFVGISPFSIPSDPATFEEAEYEQVSMFDLFGDLEQTEKEDNDDEY
jgi:hypothetical protein